MTSGAARKEAEEQPIEPNRDRVRGRGDRPCRRGGGGVGRGRRPRRAVRVRSRRTRGTVRARRRGSASAGSPASGPTTRRWRSPFSRSSPTGDADPEAIGTEMVRWYASGPRDVGDQTRAVLGDAPATHSSPRAAAETFQQRRPDAAGNGALMRTGPVALAALGDREAVARLATAVAELTHPHPDSVEACVLWSLAIERAITTARPGRAVRLVAAVAAGARPRRSPAVAISGASRIYERGRRRPGAPPPQQRVGRRRVPGGARGHHGDRRRALRLPLRPPHRGAAASRPCRWRHRHRRRHRRVAARGAVGATAVPLTWRGGSTAGGSTVNRRSTPPTSTRWPASPSATAVPTRNGWPGVAHLDYGTMPAALRRARRRLVRQRRRHPLTPSTVVPPSSCRCAGWARLTYRTTSSTTPSASSTRPPPTTRTPPSFSSTPPERSASSPQPASGCSPTASRAEHRAPSMAAAYLISRGVDVETAIAEPATPSAAS